MRKRKMVVATLALLVVGLVGVRIAWVNAHAQTVPTDHYGMGEWVDLSGSYFYDAQGEDMQGYSLRINSAQSLSYNEFVEQYAKETPGLDAKPDDPNQKTIVVLEYEVKNEGNEAGGIGLFYHDLIPARKNVAYRMDDKLWLLSEPQMMGVSGGFSLEKNSSYVTYIPFSFVSDPPYFQKLDRQINQPVADDTSFELALCNAPVRKIIDVQIA